MRDGDRHVVPNPGGGWDVKAENAKRSSSHHETQAEAIERAREIIRNKGGGELTVHGEDGRVRERDTVAAADSAAGAAKAPAKKTANRPAAPARAAAEPPAATAGGTDEVVGELRGDGGLADTRPQPPVTAAPASPTFGDRLRRLFGRPTR